MLPTSLLFLYGNHEVIAVQIQINESEQQRCTLHNCLLYLAVMLLQVRSAEERVLESERKRNDVVRANQRQATLHQKEVGIIEYTFCCWSACLHLSSLLLKTLVTLWWSQHQMCHWCDVPLYCGCLKLSKYSRAVVHPEEIGWRESVLASVVETTHWWL